MKRHLAATATAFALALAIPSSALAQSGHFIEGGSGAPTCRDIGLQVTCTGKVAGLGGTTFEITVEAEGVAKIVCHNPSGKVVPGKDTTVDVVATTGPLPTPRNGQYTFDLTTNPPAPPPPKPTCPNKNWTPEIVDVTFTTATLSLLEDDSLSDQVVVKVS
jgi:hypothetical protein